MGGDLSPMLAFLESAILKKAPLATFAVDSHYRIIYQNEAVLQLLGLTTESQGKQSPCYSFYYRLEEPCSFCPFTSLTTDSAVHSLSVTTFDEVPKEIHLEIKHLILEDKKIGKIVVEYLHDVTRQKLKELEYSRNERLIALGLVTRLVAHELQNPLAGINLTLQTLSKTTNPEELKKKIEVMQRDLEMARLIIADIQNFNRRDGLQMQTLELRKLLEDSIENMRRLAPRSRLITEVQFRLFWQADADIKIFGNETRLHQVFSNLIKNSYEAAQRPGRRAGPLIFWIVVSLKPMEGEELPSSPTSPKQVEIRIIDNAGGISKEILKRVFDPFFTTKKRLVKGSGLGLFVVQKILEEHSAAIDMTSRGHYTIVTLFFDAVT